MHLCICILDWLMGAAGHGQDDGDRCRGTRPPRIVPHLAGGEAAADESCEAAQCVSLPARRPHTTSLQRGHPPAHWTTFGDFRSNESQNFLEIFESGRHAGKRPNFSKISTKTEGAQISKKNSRNSGAGQLEIRRFLLAKPADRGS